MKECKYCRSLYEDSLPICPNCGGNKVVTEREKAEENALEQKEIENRENAIAAPLKMRKNILIGIGVVIASIITIVAIASINANKPYSDGTTKDEATNLLETGMDYFNSGDYEAAIEYFSQLPSDSKEYEEAQSMIKKSSESYCAGILAKVDTYIENEEYEIAIEILGNALKILPNDEKLKSAYNSAYSLYQSSIISIATERAEKHADIKDYISAMEVIQAALDKVENDVDLTVAYNKYASLYKTEIIKKAKEAFDSGDYEKPISIIQEGLNLLPNDQELAKKQGEYENKKPIALSTLKCYKTDYEGGFSYRDTDTDIFGNSFSDIIYHSHGFSSGSSKASETYRLDKKYTKITGTIFLGSNNSYSGEIKIYGDGKLLYLAENIESGFETVEFNLNISTVTDLEIYIDDPDFYGASGERCLANVMLYPAG